MLWISTRNAQGIVVHLCREIHCGQQIRNPQSAIRNCSQTPSIPVKPGQTNLEMVKNRHLIGKREIRNPQSSIRNSNQPPSKRVKPKNQV
jgi:hypothetical protein